MAWGNFDNSEGATQETLLSRYERGFRSARWTIALVTIFSLVVVRQAISQCACGPDFCIDEARYVTRLALKKSDLRRAGYPDELIRLLDRAAHCFAAIDRAPDIFSLMTVKSNGELLITEWSEDNEQIARQNLQEGRLRGYYKFNVREAFACCKQLRPAEGPDWDPVLAISKSQTIACTNSDNSVVCR